MKILVICGAYPDLNGDRSLAYVHTRNTLYQSRGSEVEVISFKTKDNYEIDGIKVFPSKSLSKERAKSYDLVLFHAANLRQHWLLLKKFNKEFKKIVFFFHGHEVLKISEVYSKPFDYVHQNKFRNWLQDIYDEFKFKVWRKTFSKIANKSYFIFVSNWMKDEFIRWIKPDEHLLKGRSFITYNCVGKTFEEGNHNKKHKKDYDFITIRSLLDNSKYGVDIVNELALNNPNLKFLLIGPGSYFNYHSKAPNIDWIPRQLGHEEITEYLDKAKIALMPTRTDAQGVMMCEMAAYGMPVVTSNIPVCYEVFEGFKGIAYIDNENLEKVNLNHIKTQIENEGEKNPRYFYSIVGNKEYDLLETINNTTT